MTAVIVPLAGYPGQTSSRHVSARGRCSGRGQRVRLKRPSDPAVTHTQTGLTQPGQKLRTCSSAVKVMSSGKCGRLNVCGRRGSLTGRPTSRADMNFSWLLLVALSLLLATAAAQGPRISPTPKSSKIGKATVNRSLKGKDSANRTSKGYAHADRPLKGDTPANKPFKGKK